MACLLRVNVIAPGHLQVHAAGGRDDAGTHAGTAAQSRPAWNQSSAWDIACAARFLVSGEARWVSGVALPVDAGLLAATPLAVYQNIREDD